MEVLEEYYRGYAKIDLDAIYDNIKALKNNISKDVTVTAVIKSDGYGHGAVPIAKTVDNLVSAYAVATIHEAINLREHGIHKPIYILGFTHESMFEEAIKQNIRLTVYDGETAEIISKTAESINKTADIHIKTDTGMSRIGFKDNSESIEIIKRISKLPGINIEGIYTHFSAADEKNKHSVHIQLKRFINFIDNLKKENINIPIIHCANSAGVIDLPENSFSTVRAGIAIYGLYPSEDVNKETVKLKPALSLKSHIIQLKWVDKGTGIGYGSTYITDRETHVATIPIGYGDGYPRSLSNKGNVLINGERARIIGRVCMDQFMVDVTHLKNVENGDVVTLVGTDGNEVITVEELSEQAGTFNYEFVCDIGKRIPRIYFRNDKIVCIKDYFHDTYLVNM